jgi:hypothetical protein
MGNGASAKTYFYPLRFTSIISVFASVSGKHQGLARSVCERLIGVGTSKDVPLSASSQIAGLIKKSKVRSRTFDLKGNLLIPLRSRIHPKKDWLFLSKEIY